MQQTIQEQGNRIQTIQYENIGLQGEIRVKVRQIVTLQRNYVDYLSGEDKSNGIIIIEASTMKKQSICTYLYADNMVIEGTRPGCCWHVIKAAPYLPMEIQRMLLLPITSGEGIG